jgi:hypothetical protein
MKRIVRAAAPEDEAGRLLGQLDRQLLAPFDDDRIVPAKPSPLFLELAELVRRTHGAEASRILAPLERALLETACGGWRFLLMEEALPMEHAALRAEALMVDDLREEDGGLPCFLSARTGDEAPRLVVMLSGDDYVPVFHAQALFVPEKTLLFVGYQEDILVYRLDLRARVARHQVTAGFWHWERHGDLVLLGSEVELAALDFEGKERWSAFVDPPWISRVEGGRVVIEDFRGTRSFPLATGPAERG